MGLLIINGSIGHILNKDRNRAEKNANGLPWETESNIHQLRKHIMNKLKCVCIKSNIKTKLKNYL